MAAQLLIVVGSATRPGRLRQALVDAAATTTQNPKLIDLGELRLAFADGRPPEELGDDTAWAIEQVQTADAVVLATPTYRASMTGALKNLLDHLPVPSLAGKVVGLAVMGGSRHHYLGADRHLRDCLAFFGAMVLPVPVYLTPADFPDGAPSEAAVEALADLIAATAAVAEQLSGGELGPPPLSAGMVRG